MLDSGYNPTISGLLKTAITDWGDPAENLKNMVFYQTAPEFDTALYGVDIIDGELNTIQAPKKSRKSTLLANWALHFLIQLRERNMWIDIDTLESGMTPKAYRDVLIAILATRFLIGKVLGTNRRDEWPPAKEIFAHPDMADELQISRKFLRFRKRTPLQQESIDRAIAYLGTTKLSVFGAARDAGESRSLAATISRWEQLYDGEYKTDAVDMRGFHHRMFATDNVQQYREYAGNSYSGLETVTNALSNFVASHPGAVVFAVSQVSQGSQRRANDVGEEMEARGGTRLAEESVTVFQPSYDRDKSPLELIIKTPFSRYEPPPTIVQEIEPASGSFLRPGRPAYSD